MGKLTWGMNGRWKIVRFTPSTAVPLAHRTSYIRLLTHVLTLQYMVYLCMTWEEYTGIPLDPTSITTEYRYKYQDVFTRTPPNGCWATRLQYMTDNMLRCSVLPDTSKRGLWGSSIMPYHIYSRAPCFLFGTKHEKQRLTITRAVAHWLLYVHQYMIPGIRYTLEGKTKNYIPGIIRTTYNCCSTSNLG